jgi:CheY-like chemotaxis protein
VSKVESGGVKDLPSPTHPLTHSFTPKHVLVVDDSPINREVLASLLAHAGVTSVDQACDGGEALAKLVLAERSDNPYDFVFSDLWMPNMNGIELIEKLRADSRFTRLTVFAVTADTEFQRDDRNKLFSGILLKPLTYNKLVEAFTTAKRKKR